MNRNILISLDALGSNILESCIHRMPNLAGVMDNGLQVKRLKTVFPSVTWAIHTSVLTGTYPEEHYIFGNRVLDRNEGKTVKYFDPGYCKLSDLTKVKTLIEAVHDAGMSCDAVCWPLTQGAKGIRHNIPEFYLQNDFDSHSSPQLWNELQELNFPVTRYGAWSSDHSLNPLQDALTMDICSHLFINHRSDLLLSHLLSIDSFLHDFGLDSPEVLWAAEYTDTLIGRLLQRIEEAGEKDSTNIIFFSDHGQAPIHTELELNVFLKANGFHKWQGVSNGGSAFLYHDGPDRGLQPGSEERLEKVLLSMPWTERVIARENFQTVHFPVTPDPHGFLPDLILELTKGYSCGNDPAATETEHPSYYKAMHGYSADQQDMYGFLAATGPDIPRHVLIREASILDIAPTMTAVLGLSDRIGTGTALFDREAAHAGIK
ncbi:MAG: alkaline phosphatase family protein [Spirochaetales bacterium]|nr:alkaline phosphatase family protein [Spirochaetales bacterium]